MSRRRIRIYSPFYPYPVTEGAYQVIFDQAWTLAQRHEVELVVWKSALDQVVKANQGRDPFQGKVRIHSLSTGTPQRENPLQRGLRVANSLLGQDASPALFYYPPIQDKRPSLSPVSLSIYHYSFASTWFRREDPSQRRRDGERVVYLHNLEADLMRYRAETESGGLSARIHRRSADLLDAAELGLGSWADGLWFISTQDAEDYRRRFPQVSVPIRIRPPTYSCPRARDFERGGPLRVGFIGGLDFGPNRSSLEWILDHVCPLLEKENWKGRLQVAGRGAPLELREKMARFNFVEALGFVPDLEKFWRGLSLTLVPHLDGSGVRIKLLDAVARGVPVLANQAAVGRVADSVTAWPGLRVSNDPALWAQEILSLRGMEWRASVQDAELPREMSGEVVYSDLV